MQALFHSMVRHPTTHTEMRTPAYSVNEHSHSTLSNRKKLVIRSTHADVL